MLLCRMHVLATGQTNVKERWIKDAALFDAAADFEWLRGAAIALHCSRRVSVEGLDHAMQFGWAIDLWENLKSRLCCPYQTH